MNSPVLIDTSAWITYFDPDFRGLPAVADEVELLIGMGRARYTELVYMELFVGVESEDEVRKFRSAFSGIQVSSLVEGSIWDDAHENAYRLWKSGLKPRLVDVIIATVALHYDIHLFHHDRHFVKMGKVLPDLKQYSMLRK